MSVAEIDAWLDQLRSDILAAIPDATCARAR
jgi:hypothetical protein